jgi:hypothetical protein
VSGFYTIYHLSTQREDDDGEYFTTLVVGSGAMEPSLIEEGSCTTICKIQGSEFPVCVCVISKEIAMSMVDYRNLIVLLSRPRRTLYFVLEKMEHGITDIIQKFANEDGIIRRSKLSEKMISHLKRKREEYFENDEVEIINPSKISSSVSNDGHLLNQ